MAVTNTLFVAFSLMFLEAHSRPDLVGMGDSRTFNVGHLGREFYIVGSSVTLPSGIQISPSQILDHGWRKNGRRITIPRQLLGYLDLQLENPSPEDEGDYRCFVQSEFGTMLGPGHTVLNPVLSTASARETPLHGFVNTSIVLPCPILSVPTGEVRWVTSNNLTIEPNHPRYKQLSSGSLLILALRPEDSQVFHCYVQNWVLDDQVGASVSLSVNRTVQNFGPFILDTFPSTVTLTNSETQEFYCLGSGVPSPRSSWILSTPLHDDSFLTHPQTEHTSLGNRIWLNKENGSATYDCVVTVGSEQISKSMDTHAPPSFPNLPDLRYPAAKTVRFECKSTTPRLLWYKDGDLLETNSGRLKTRGSELVISNTVSADSGVYQCEAGKFLATGSLVIETSLEGLSPPLDLICSLSSSRSIQVTWKVHPQDEDSIKAFSIHYTPTSGGVETQKVTNNTNALLESLLPNTNYSIYVRAYSIKSASPQSERVYCSTSDDSPPKKPSSLQFHVIGNSSVRLSWEMPTLTSGGVISFAVEVTTSLQNKNESSVLLTNETSVTLENLTENTNYFVRVMAETDGSGGSGEYSSTIVFRISNNQNQTLKGNSSTSTSSAGQDSTSSTQHPDDFLANEHNLGLILGITLGILSIIICGTIIVCRNRCFSFLLRRGRRTRRGSYVTTGNISGKDTVDSAPLEMKDLTSHLEIQGQHLDTKGGHPDINGGVCDPLVGERVRGEDEGDIDMSS